MARRGPGSLAANTAANFGAQFLVPAVALLAVPVYLRYIGLAGYGLVSILGALLASMEIFTRGLGWSLQREVARAHAVDDRDRVSALITTFALGYWFVGAVLGALLAAASGPVAGLLKRDGVSEGSVRLCLLVLAVRLATVFPGSVYQAALRGLRRQVALNGINSVVMLIATAAMLSAVAVTQSVVALYVTDLVFAAISLLVLRAVTRRMPDLSGAETRFLRRGELKSIWALSAGLVWVQGAGMLIKQSDRFFVAALRSLSSVGVYTAGSAAGKLLSLSYSPYLAAVFPESCALAQVDPGAMPRHVIRNSRIVALTALGFGVPLALSGREILTVWTNNDRVVAGGTSVLAVYVVGSMLLALVDTLSQTHTALGTSRCSVIFNTAAVLWIGPVTYVLVDRFGIIGAAVTWLLYGASAWLVFTLYTFTRLLPGGLGRYLWAMVVPASLITVLDGVAALAARAVFPDQPLRYLAVMIPAAAVLLVVAAVASIGPRTTVALLRRVAGGLREPGLPHEPAELPEPIAGDRPV